LSMVIVLDNVTVHVSEVLHGRNSMQSTQLEPLRQLAAYHCKVLTKGGLMLQWSLALLSLHFAKVVLDFCH